MSAAASVGWADPSRVYAEALEARALIEDARASVAGLLSAAPRSVIFTSGATESIGAAVFGSDARTPGGLQIFAATEHSAVRQWCERHAHEVLPVGTDGLVDLDALDRVLADDRPIAAVHVGWVNHETGIVQPIEQIAARCRAAKVLLDVDAAAAVGRVPVDFDASGAALMSVSGHKLGGPPGTGALLVRRGLRVPPLIVGGDQERARRAGMENTVGLVGFGAAAQALAAGAYRAETEAGRQDVGGGLDDDVGDLGGGGVRSAGSGAGGASSRFGAAARGLASNAAFSNAVVRGQSVLGRWQVEAKQAEAQTQRVREWAVRADCVTVVGGAEEFRAPHIVCLLVDGVEPQGIVLGLDRIGVAVHSGSACTSGELEPSPVLAAMGLDAHHSLRVSVGWTTTDADIDRFIAAADDTIAYLRGLARP